MHAGNGFFYCRKNFYNHWEIIKVKIFKRLLLVKAITLMSVVSYNANADAFIDALKGGKVDLNFNLRYEYVDDERTTLTDNEANSLTVRTALGYKTGMFHNVFGYLQFENITPLTDSDQYNDTQNGNTTLPVIADPSETEINQAYLGFKPFANSVIKVGRQNITPRKAPFHRFLGNVLWRQNWQTQDAVTVSGSYNGFEYLGGYIWNNNTIFGTDRDMEAPIFNVKYNGFKHAKLEAYYYDLDFTNDSPANSSTTIGGRINGAYPILSDKTKLIYAGEFANQTDTGENPNDYDANYYLIEGGVKTKFDSEYVKSLMVKASYEVLESDGGNFAFRTPLGTNHAFQGWADLFLTTPNAGIEDTYFTMVATGKYDTKLIVSYHMFEAETGGFDYGDEIDIWFTKKFNKKYTLGIKYAAYDASSDAGNPRSTDLARFWTYIGFKF